jgi:hypothetical protein
MSYVRTCSCTQIVIILGTATWPPPPNPVYVCVYTCCTSHHVCVRGCQSFFLGTFWDFSASCVHVSIFRLYELTCLVTDDLHVPIHDQSHILSMYLPFFLFPLLPPSLIVHVRMLIVPCTPNPWHLYMYDWFYPGGGGGGGIFACVCERARVCRSVLRCLSYAMLQPYFYLACVLESFWSHTPPPPPHTPLSSLYM